MTGFCLGDILAYMNHQYTPDSNFEYGIPKTTNNKPDQSLPGHAYLADFRGDEDGGHFTKSETVSLEQTRSMKTTETTELDVSTTVGAKLGGGYAGASFEAEVSRTMGVKNSKETEQANSESKTASDTVAIDADLPAYEATAIDCTADQKTTDTMFDLHGIRDGKFRLSLPYTISGPARGFKYLASNKNRNPFTRDSVVEGGTIHPTRPLDFNDRDALASWLHGYDIAWQGMQGFFDAAPDNIKAAWRRLLGDKYWTVNIKGQRNRQFESQANYKVWQLNSDQEVEDFKESNNPTDVPSQTSKQQTPNEVCAELTHEGVFGQLVVDDKGDYRLTRQDGLPSVRDALPLVVDRVIIHWAGEESVTLLYSDYEHIEVVTDEHSVPQAVKAMGDAFVTTYTGFHSVVVPKPGTEQMRLTI